MHEFFDSPNLDLSRIADGIQQIANVVAPRSISDPLALSMKVEVASIETGIKDVREKDGGSARRKCVTYTISSPQDEEQTKFVSMSIRFLLREDPKWSAGQRIRIAVRAK